MLISKPKVVLSIRMKGSKSMMDESHELTERTINFYRTLRKLSEQEIRDVFNMALFIGKQSSEIVNQILEESLEMRKLSQEEFEDMALSLSSVKKETPES